MAESTIDIAVEVVRDRASLTQFLAQWEDLAAHALEPNPLYEPAMMLPALAAAECDLHYCLLWVRDPERADLPASLGGLVPLQRLRRHKRLPTGALCSWRHPSGLSCTPLIRTEGARQTVTALLDWLQRYGAAVVELSCVPRGGAFEAVLADALRDHASTVFACDVAAPAGLDRLSMRDFMIGIGAFGEMWVSMLALISSAKRRITGAARSGSPAVTA